MGIVQISRVLSGALAICLIGLAGNVHADTPKSDPASSHSTQPGSDVWITTKVKADLLATRDVPGLDLKVETLNGVVTLTGTVATQAEADRAVRVARGIEGVSQVVSTGISVSPKR
jgi:hyperosmotically inducible protein